MTSEEPKVAKGFDRDVDYEPMKEKLINEYNKLGAELVTLSTDDKNYVSKKRIIVHKMMYLTIACIQLRSGCRIIEAVQAFKQFIKNKDTEKRVTVKIAKSESTKYKKDTGEKFRTKARYREISFPNNWIKLELYDDMKFFSDVIENKSFKKRVLDYMLKYFNCNTHSLRYAFINYMIYVQKRPLNDVAKFVGHVDTTQLTRYTQIKNTNQIFDLNI